jgi:hypothetical protein
VGQTGSVYKHPEKREDDSCHSWRAPSKWKGEYKGGTKGSKKGIARGARGKWEKEQRVHAMYICNCNVCERIIEC